MACGAALAAADETGRQVRKIITVLFSAVTYLATSRESVDSETLRWIMERYRAGMRVAIEQNGGRVERFIGDAVMAVFGLPASHDDDAVRAVRAAVEINAELERIYAALPVRLDARLAAATGVNTGEVFIGEDAVRGGSGELIADAVNVAARLQSAAAPGEVLIGEGTYRRTRGEVGGERVELTLKGKSDPVVAFRLRSVAPPGGSYRELAAPTVGRERETRALADAFAVAVAERRCLMVTVSGDAGAGKSRLIRDALESLNGHARTFVGRCLPNGEGTIYWPLAEIARQAAAAGRGDPPDVVIDSLARVLEHSCERPRDVAARLAGVFGMGALAGAPEEVNSDVCMLLAALTSTGPAVVVVEDIHWGGDRLLALLEHAVQRLDDHPLLLICSARPDLRESCPTWGSSLRDPVAIDIGPLDELDSLSLLAALLGDQGIALELVAPVGELALGNPLIVEEVVAMLIDEGVLMRVDDAWVLASPVEKISIPPTVDAVFTARLDRLASGERDLIEAAAIVGKDFDEADVRALLDTDERSLRRSLCTLRDRQLIDSQSGGTSEFRFHHMLIRDAAYASTPKRRRAALHERLATYIEASPAGHRGGLYEEIAGEHLERACVYRRDLGEGDSELRDIAHRAGTLLMEAGIRARGLSDFPAARRVYERAEAVVAREDQLRPTLLAGQAEIFADLAMRRETCEAADEAISLARTVGDQAAGVRATIARTLVEYAAGERALAGAEQELRELAHRLEREGDPTSVIWGWMAVGNLFNMAGLHEAAYKAATRATRLASRSLPAALPYCLVGSCVAIMNSPMPVSEALRRCEEALSQVQQNTLHAAWIHARGIAPLETLLGRFEPAERRFANATAVCERYGSNIFAHMCLVEWGYKDMLAEDYGAAELHFRRARELAAPLDPTNYAYAEGFRAWALARLGRYSEALEATRPTAELIRPDAAEAHVYTHVAAALALCGLGDRGAAAERAAEAVACARQVPSPMMLGDALSCLGEVMLAEQRREDAAAALREALDAYDLRGIVPARERAKELLEASGLTLAVAGAPRPADARGRA